VIKNDIERPRGAVWITLFAGFDESFSAARRHMFDEDDYLLIRCSIKELVRHGLTPGYWKRSAEEWNKVFAWLTRRAFVPEYRASVPEYRASSLTE